MSVARRHTRRNVLSGGEEQEDVEEIKFFQ